VRKVIQLGESLFDSYFENQVWTESNHGPYEFNKIITIFAAGVAAEAGASSKRGPTEASSAAAEPCSGARRRQGRASLLLWLAKRWLSLQQEVWAALLKSMLSQRILFVGVNSDVSADLCLKREFEKIDAALEGTFGRNSTEKPSLKQIPYAAWNEVLKEIMRYHSTVLCIWDVIRTRSLA